VVNRQGFDFYKKTLFFPVLLHAQGLPSGFDLMYLALADKNMQVRFGLKVVGGS
jgi:hypothetical protein